MFRRSVVGSAYLGWWGSSGVKPKHFDTKPSMCHVIIDVSVEESIAVLPSHFARLFYLEVV